MVRTAVADDYLLSYLTNIARQNTCVGLILGQPCLGKDYIIHFAKTPTFQPEEDKKANLPAKQIKNISEVNEKWVADHARHATRMLPGGMFVLGIFIVSPEDLLSQFSSKIKVILSAIQKELDGNTYLYGNNNAEKLVLNYCTKTEKYMLKSYDVNTSRVQPADIKFLPKANRWNSVDCCYVIDQMYYLKANEADFPLQKHIKGILEDINNNLESSMFLFDGESKDGEENFENIGKKRKVPRSTSSKSHPDLHDTRTVEVSIFQSSRPSSNGESKTHEVFQSAGQLRIVGQVACKLWLQPKISITEASKAIKQDIMRSLCTRFEMHWDSLTEEENSEDINCVHEPPRRVLITLPNSKITLSDYLFPGEGAQDAKLSLEELLDVKISGKLEIQDVEGQADISEYYKDSMESESEEVLPKLPTDANKFMYIVGLAVALLVLVVSLLMHYYK